MEHQHRPTAPPDGWRAPHLLSVDDLMTEEIHYLLSLSGYYAGFLTRRERPPQTLAGHTQVNLFFEDSTRTNLSFELAGSKLGADVLNVPVAASSVNKGETLIDTAQTLAAMGADIMIVRHQEQGVHQTLAARIDAPIINAGDGAGEHPTQALLDAATILDCFGHIDGLTIAICGDILHSRVAGSGARLLSRLGAKVRFIGPEHLLPPAERDPSIAHFHDLENGLAEADVVMGLRMQFERMADGGTAAAAGYFDQFGLTHESLRWAKPGAKIMHPGPMNRGVEIDGQLADDPERSLILRQVFFGVALRMAVLDTFVAAR